MNIINQNGYKVIQTSEYIEVDGERTIIPDYVKSGWNNSLKVDNKTIIINGYVFDPKTKQFKPKALKGIKNFLTSFFK